MFASSESSGERDQVRFRRNPAGDLNLRLARGAASRRARREEGLLIAPTQPSLVSVPACPGAIRSVTREAARTLLNGINSRTGSTPDLRRRPSRLARSVVAIYGLRDVVVEGQQRLHGLPRREGEHVDEAGIQWRRGGDDELRRAALHQDCER